MGQYHLPVNLDKKEFLMPHRLGAGLKQWEQLVNSPSTPQAMFILTCASNNRGGGDIRPHDVLGRWAGDRIAVVGDYSEDSDLDPDLKASEIYANCLEGKDGWADISDQVAEVIEAEFEGQYEGDGWRRFKGGFA